MSKILTVAVLVVMTIVSSVALFLTIEAQDEGLPDLWTRYNEIPGGVQIQSERGGVPDFPVDMAICTSGFAAKVLADPYTGEYYYGYTTAAHCVEHLEDVYQPECCDSEYYAGWTYFEADPYGYDIAFVFYDGIGSPDLISPYIATDNGFKPVMRYGVPERGDIVCKTGRTTNVTCGEVVDQEDEEIFCFEIAPGICIWVTYRDVYVVDMTDWYIAHGVPAVQGGDSGGPVWWYYYDPIYHYQGVKVYGTVTGGNNYTLCFSGMDLYELFDIEPLLIYGKPSSPPTPST